MKSTSAIGGLRPDLQYEIIMCICTCLVLNMYNLYCTVAAWSNTGALKLVSLWQSAEQLDIGLQANLFLLLLLILLLLLLLLWWDWPQIL